MALSDTTKTNVIVMKLLDPLINRGHTLYMYSFYNSPELATKLKVEYFTDCMGPVRVYRQSVLKEIKGTKLKRRETITRHLGPVSVLKCYDQKERKKKRKCYHGVNILFIQNERQSVTEE
jgi:hypothetical protein